MKKNNTSRYQIDMLNGPLFGKILLFALPLMLSSILQLLFNAADVVVVGRYSGKEALAAVGSTTALINLILNLFMGLSVGTNVLLAKELGAGRREEARQGMHTAITFALLGGIILSVIGICFSRTFLTWMSSPTDVIDLSALYLKIYFCGVPGNLVYNFGAAALRSQGDTRRPLYYLTAAGIINVVLNLFFVRRCGMSVDGVALATIISQYISAILVVRCLRKDADGLHLDWHLLRLDRESVKKILKVGFPSGLQGMMFSLSNVVIQSSLNSFDSTVLVAASSAAANIEGFGFACVNVFSQTALTFISQNVGACQKERVLKIRRHCILCSVAMGLLFGGITLLFGHGLVSIYAPGEEEVIACAIDRLRFIGTPYFLSALMDVQVGILRGLGYSIYPMVCTLVAVCGLRLLWVAVVFPCHRTPENLYLSYPVSWLVAAICLLLFYYLVRRKALARITPDKIFS